MANVFTNGLQKIADDANSAILNQAELAKTLFFNEIDQADQYVYGVVQSEVKSGGATGAVASVAGYNLYNVNDHIVGLNAKTGTLVILDLNEGTVVQTNVLEKGKYTLKAMSKGKQESIYFITPRFLRRLLGMRQPDPYKRTKFTVTADNVSRTFLVGSYGPGEHTSFPSFNNNAIFEALKALAKEN